MKGFEFPDSSDTELENTSPENNTVQEQDNYNSSINSSDEIESEVRNFNPYEETVVNNNPYQNVNIEDVITTEERKTPSEPATIVEDKAPSEPATIVEDKTPKRELTEDELTDLEIERIKAQRALKIKNIRGVFVIFMLIVLITVAVAYNRSDKSKEKIEIDPIDIHFQDDDKKDNVEFSAELNNYYQTRDKTNIEKQLVDSAEDPEKMKTINNIAANQIDKLIEDAANEAGDSLDFDNKIRDIKDYMTSLNNIKFNDAKILKDTDYNGLLEKLDHLKDVSTDYFTGLNYYNAKDYNNAFSTFNNIPEDNYFKKAANNRTEKITKEIIELLESDIANLSTNLDYMDQGEKKEKYLQIKSIIEQYNKAYPYLHLESNQTYNDLLQKYTELSN